MSDNTTYLELIDAIQAYVVDTAGDDRIARDWVLVMGVQTLEDIASDEMNRVEIRSARSPHTTPYTVTGLLDFAGGCFTATEMDEDEED